MIVIAGTVKVKSGAREEALRLARDIAQQSAGDNGCLSYRFYADPERIALFLKC